MLRFLGAVIKGIAALLLVLIFLAFLGLFVLIAKFAWILALGFFGCVLAYIFIGEAWDALKKRRASD